MNKSIPKTEDTTDFGYQRVPVDEKARRVGAVFDSVADRYDLMNDLMSLGLHRLWKRFAVMLSGVRAGHTVLDLAGGTGDLAARLRSHTGESGRVVLADLNAAMLDKGRRRLVDSGIATGVEHVQADAESLPFPGDTFDCVLIGFGLRNVARKERALAAVLRVLKPGGRLVVLEFSRLRVAALEPLYQTYSFRVLPRLGALVTGNPDSYRYLAESIRMHPDQETLQRFMEAAGFARCEHFNLAAGIVALHRGYKL